MAILSRGGSRFPCSVAMALIGSSWALVLAGCDGEVRPPAGGWGLRAPLLEPNSEFAVAEREGRIYVIGGYPPDRVTRRTVQIYDPATDTWTLGPPVPVPNNHGMAASVNGRIYLIGGQIESGEGDSFVDTVYELDPAVLPVGRWVEKAPMPTRRSGGLAVVVDGKIYVAGGRPPAGQDFAVYDPVEDRWETLPPLPTPRNHLAMAVTDGVIHVVGGRLGYGFRSEKTDVHEVFNPSTRQWSVAAPLPRARSGINGALAWGCFHVWGGEEEAGMIPDHDYYDPRTDQWTSLPDMPIPVHGVKGSVFLNGLIHAPGGGVGVGGSSGSLFNQVYRPAVSCE